MRIENFLNSESGAITVDWVVLTAAIVGLGLGSAAVVSGGVEDLSGETQAELVAQGVTNPFDDGEIAGMDWGAYVPIAAQHGVAWGNEGLDNEGRTWAENTYEGWSSGWDDEQLVAEYSTHYAYATSNPTSWGETQTRADYVAIAEQIMTDRGIDVPEGNMTAAELRETF